MEKHVAELASRRLKWIHWVLRCQEPRVEVELEPQLSGSQNQREYMRVCSPHSSIKGSIYISLAPYSRTV